MLRPNYMCLNLRMKTINFSGDFRLWHRLYERYAPGV